MNDHTLRLDKALEQLKQRGLDGLIIYSNGAPSIMSPRYLHYFSGLKPMGPHNAMIISKSGDVALLVEPPWDSIRTSKKTWVSDVRGSSDFVADLTKIMRDFKIEGTVGIAGLMEMTENVYSGISGEAAIKPTNDIIEEIAGEKTEEEISLARKTGRVADVGFKAFMEYARPGIREYELSAEVGCAMRSEGADDIFILLSAGKHNRNMHAPTDKRLMEGDTVIGEITPVCEGQTIQLCRTLVLGKSDPVLAEKYGMLVRALKASLQQIKAGVPASVISIAMNEIISEAGYAKYCYPPYMRARGHGFGVGSIAPGTLIDDETKTNLEKGQVVIAHPNQYILETGYLACGETVLVTATGMERLSETETKLYSKEV
ncbi:M24 family metallopeptidase [Thermodesulfobacteriota bacterium]